MLCTQVHRELKLHLLSDGNLEDSWSKSLFLVCYSPQNPFHQFKVMQNEDYGVWQSNGVLKVHDTKMIPNIHKSYIPTGHCIVHKKVTSVYRYEWEVNPMIIVTLQMIKDLRKPMDQRRETALWFRRFLEIAIIAGQFSAIVGRHDKLCTEQRSEWSSTTQASHAPPQRQFQVMYHMLMPQTMAFGSWDGCGSSDLATKIQWHKWNCADIVQTLWVI